MKNLYYLINGYGIHKNDLETILMTLHDRKEPSFLFNTFLRRVVLDTKETDYIVQYRDVSKAIKQILDYK